MKGKGDGDGKGGERRAEREAEESGGRGMGTGRRERAVFANDRFVLDYCNNELKTSERKLHHKKLRSFGCDSRSFVELIFRFPAVPLSPIFENILHSFNISASGWMAETVAGAQERSRPLPFLVLSMQRRRKLSWSKM